jgi:hypothetical protein
MIDHTPVWYRLYFEGESVCWFPPRELAEIMAAFRCVVDFNRRIVTLI